jgi:inner membrane protein
LKFRTHLVFALLIWIVVVKLASGEVGIEGLVFAALGGLFPDIDVPQSWIGRKIGFLSNILNFFFGHRGFFHSVFAGVLLSVLVWLLFGNWYHFTFFIGYISHLFMDGLTKEGVRPFYPFEYKIKGLIKTGGFLKRDCSLFY